MNSTGMKKLGIALVCSSAALLAACGGGGGGSDAVPPAAQDQVPQSASASVAAMVDYLVGLVGGHSESSAPLDVSGFKPPVSETAEPTAVK